MKIIAVIPARYASTRFPGKPLADILGKPMVWRVFNRVKSIDKIDEVYVATDDSRISSVCEKYNIPFIMTSNNHLTAANRLQEVSEKVNGDYFIQINGDEPLINEKLIESIIIDDIPLDKEFGVNIISKIDDPILTMDPSNIKVVYDNEMNMVYMSRTPIPYPFKSLDFSYYKHVGIIGYNKRMLDFYKNSNPGRFELIEGIDTLRFIDYGKQLKCVIVNGCESLSVDTEKDLKEVINIMERQINEK